jgi:hypothetical protein
VEEPLGPVRPTEVGGGVGLAWRMAKPPARWWLLLRPLTAPALAFVACFGTVTLMGLLFPSGTIGHRDADH